MRVLIVSNCQTAHIHRATEHLVAEADVTSYSMNQLDEVIESGVLKGQAHDLFIGHPSAIEKLRSHSRSIEIETYLEIKPLLFSAYHPDCFYIKVDGKILKTRMDDYNSILTLVSYRKGLSVSDARSLFSASTYEMLGFTSLWEVESARLLADYQHLSFDVLQWIQVKASAGSFMHTINHPKPHVVVDLVYFGLISLGIEVSNPDYDCFPDYLASGPKWPVYPEIADAMSIAGGYQFKAPEQYSRFDLTDYIEDSFAIYEARDLRSALVEPICYHSGYDRALEVIERL